MQDIISCRPNAGFMSRKIRKLKPATSLGGDAPAAPEAAAPSAEPNAAPEDSGAQQLSETEAGPDGEDDEI